MSYRQPLRSRILAVLVGVAVPSTIFGKAGIAIPLALAFILAAPEWIQGRTWRDLGQRIWTPVGWAVIATAVLWLPGVLFSILPELSFEAWGRTWIFVLVATVFWDHLERTANGRDTALRALVVAVAVTLALSATGFAVPQLLSLIHARGWTPEVPALILKPFAAVAMLMIPVLLWIALRSNGKWRVMATLESIGLLWLLIVTENRASMAGLLAMLVVVGIILILRGRNRRVLIGVSVAIPLAAALVLGWMSMIPHSHWAPSLLRDLNHKIPVWLIDPPRQEIWGFTWTKILESPWIGHGINTVNYLPGADQVIPNMGGRLTFIPGHPHDWVLEILAETGVVGLLPLITAAGLFLYSLARAYRRTCDAAFLATACVHVGYWASGLFNFSFWSAWWQVSYVLLLAITYPGRPRAIVQPCPEEEEKSVVRGTVTAPAP